MKTIKNTIYMLNFVFKADKKSFSIFLFTTILNLIPTFFNIIIFKVIIDFIEQQRDLIDILVIIGIYATSQFFVSILNYWQWQYYYPKLEIKVTKLMSDLLLNKIIQIDVEKLDDPDFSDKVQRAFDETESRALDVFKHLFFLLNNALTIALSISIVVLLNPLLIFLVVFSIIISFTLELWFIKRKYKKQNEMASVNRKIYYYKDVLRQRNTVSEIRQFPTFKNLFLYKYRESLDDKKEIMVSLSKSGFKKSFVSNLSYYVLNYSLPIMYLAHQASHKIITLGDISALWNAFTTVSSSSREFSEELAVLRECSLFTTNFREIMEYEGVIEVDKTSKGYELNEIETIEFKDVSFVYPKTENNVIDNVSFKVAKGDVVALVGENGAGKSTIVKLLMRFYDVTDGEILINDTNIKFYNIESVRCVFSSVFQNFQLFSMSFEELISCELVGDQNKIIKVLTKTGMLEHVTSEGELIGVENTKRFSENGLVLSGGQEQKIAISRMLYKKSSAYIMDEPSSALDPISESKINQIMYDNQQDKILFVISHRLGTTIKSNKILYFEDGKLVESGDHETLMLLGGHYATLFNVQAEKYKY